MRKHSQRRDKEKQVGKGGNYKSTSEMQRGCYLLKEARVGMTKLNKKGMLLVLDVDKKDTLPKLFLSC